MTQQSPVPLRRVNQVQTKEEEEEAGEVVPEEAVTKDVVDEADVSIAQHTNHQSGTSREKWRVLARF